MEQKTLEQLKFQLNEKQNKLKDLLAEKQELLMFASTVKSAEETQKLQALFKISESKFKQLDVEVAELLDKIKKMASN